MEKFSSSERVVGQISQEEKEEVLQGERKRFEDQSFDESWERVEKEKTAEELEIIGLVNEATNEIRQKYGLEKFDIPPENIHNAIKPIDSAVE